MADSRYPFGDPEEIRDTEATAVGRFTRTPVRLRNLYKAAKIGPDPYPEPVSGAYTWDKRKGTKDITLDLHNTPRYQDVNSASLHEQIHSLLSPSGETPPQPDDDPRQLWNVSPSIWDAEQSFKLGKRGGYMYDELPAYMGAYHPGQLNGVTPDLRRYYLDQFREKLDPSKHNLFDKMVRTNDYGLPPDQRYFPEPQSVSESTGLQPTPLRSHRYLGLPGETKK